MGHPEQNSRARSHRGCQVRTSFGPVCISGRVWGHRGSGRSCAPRAGARRSATGGPARGGRDGAAGRAAHAPREDAMARPSGPRCSRDGGSAQRGFRHGMRGWYKNGTYKRRARGAGSLVIDVLYAFRLKSLYQPCDSLHYRSVFLHAPSRRHAGSARRGQRSEAARRRFR